METQAKNSTSKCVQDRGEKKKKVLFCQNEDTPEKKKSSPDYFI